MLLSHHRLIVGIPTYNEGRFLSQTLKSLASQTDADFSVLIADNASTDNTRDIGLQFQQADPRFHFVQHDVNKGALFNVDFLLKNTESPLFMWLGGHDVLDQGYIETQLALLEQTGDASLVFSRVQWIDEDGNPLRTTDGGNFLIGGSDPLRRFINVTNHRWGECTAINSIIRRDALRNLPLLPIDGADHLLLRGLQFYGPFYRTERALYFRREISNRSTSYRERITGAKLDREATRRTIFLSCGNRLCCIPDWTFPSRGGPRICHAFCTPCIKNISFPSCFAGHWLKEWGRYSYFSHSTVL